MPVLFPVLDRHPEVPDLHSMADRSRFVLTFLGGGPDR